MTILARRREAFRRLFFERLEDRVMLDAATGTLPPPLVVGRTLSSYFVGGIQNNQETLTYTVYNEQADPETGVLLTTTLGTGVTFAGASQQPDQSGQQLAWSLGTIDGYDRASVTLTVSLATPSPTQLDSGAHAAATLDGDAVSAATPAAILRTGAVPDPSLLASTPDANTTDPFVQEEAAKLSYDPQQVFSFLQTQIGYNSYSGSLRGARGTLWSGAGNALDVASLGVALMRASGIPAQYAQGTLSYSQAQALILSMFPASNQTVGYLPSGTQTADPANDGQLQNETQNHFWFQFDTGGGMQDADPLISGATIGKTFTTSTGTFAVVPDAMREKTEVQLQAETYSQAGALFGVGGGISTATVIDQTFNDVDLVGKFLSIGNFVSTTQIPGLVFSSVTHTYSPYIDIGDMANPGPGTDETMRGQNYQEMLTNFPFGTQILTGLSLNITLSGPQGASETYQHTLLDRIGYAARQGLATPSLSTNPSDPPPINDLDITTLNVLPGLEDPHPPTALLTAVQQGMAQVAALRNSDGTYPASASPLIRQLMIAETRLLSVNFLNLSDLQTSELAAADRVTAYFDRPRLVLVSSQVQQAPGSNAASISFAIDLRRDTIRVVVAPGQASSASFAFNFMRGIEENALERQVISMALGSGASQPISTIDVFNAAKAQGVGLVFIAQANLSSLDAMNISADAKARITSAVQSGLIVQVPASLVNVGGVETTAWYTINPSTGETVGVTEDGNHQAIVSYAAALGIGIVIGGLFVAAIDFGALGNPQLCGNNPKQCLAVIGVTAVFVGVIIALLFSVLSLGFGIAALVTIPIINGYGTLSLLFAVAAGTGVGGALGGALTGKLKDPALSPLLYGLDIPGPRPANIWTAPTVQEPATLTAGSVAGSVQAAGASATGPISASWTTSTTSGFEATSIQATGATLTDANGKVLGSGSVALTTSQDVPLAISGAQTYAVNGQGRLSFYPDSATQLGVGGDWSAYSANLSGNVTLKLTTGYLMLNGSPLPAGTYSIATSSATLSGNGGTTSPNFLGSATVAINDGAVDLSQGSGSLTLGGAAIDPSNGLTFSGYTGSIAVTAGLATEAVTLTGATSNALRVFGSPATVTTDQNTPTTFKFGVDTTLADAYSLTATAPPGWTVVVGHDDVVTVTPAPGTQSGTFPVQLMAQSSTDPDLVAQATEMVSVSATKPGVTLSVAPDPIFSVPFQGAQVPSAFRATIHNSGPVADTYNLTFSNAPAGFTLASTATQLTIPAGGTVVIGVYLVPSGPLPPPGTQAPFTVTVTSTTTASITQAQDVAFTVPAINGITLTANPDGLNTTPGTPVAVAVTLTNVGNVAEDDTQLSDTLPAGLSASGLAPVSLAVGQSATETIMLTPAANTPLNSMLSGTLTATFGPSTAPQTHDLSLQVQVAAPGVEALNNAYLAASQTGRSDLGNRLRDLATALTNLVQAPTSAVYQGQALANLDSLISQLTSDPFLSGFTAGLTSARGALATANTAGGVQTAVSNLGTALASLASVMIDDAQHGFTLSLENDRQVAQPGVPEVFNIDLKNTGSVATTYDLAATGLPAGVTAKFSQPNIMLTPGQSVSGSSSPALTLSLTESGTTLIPAGFTVTATAEGATEITQSTPGALTLRNESILVAGVAANPGFTNPGGKVAVTAQIQGTVNEPTQVSASYTVADPTGKVVFTSRPVPVALTVASTLTPVDLGMLDTTGFAVGFDTITVTVADATGKPIPGASGQGSLLIGVPLTASLTTNPPLVPTGSYTVTSTIHVTSQQTFPSPLTLLGQVPTQDDELSTVLSKNNLAYEVGANGISVIDVSNPASPKVLNTFAQDTVVKGGYNIAKVVGNDLLVATNVSLNSSGFNFIVYDLTNPTNPTLVSNTAIPYRFLSDMYVLGNVALFPIEEFDFFPAGADTTYFAQSSNVIAVDISNLAKPTVVGKLFASNDPHPQGGAVILNSQVAYTVSSTETGGDTSHGVGDVRLLNIANPAMPTLTGDLQIPGTETLTNITLQGNRALVVGSSGGLLQPFDFNKTGGLTGNVTLTVLDVSNPASPKVLGSTLVTEATSSLDATLPSARRDLVDLGNGLFALSNVLEGGKPALLLINASDPNNIIVGAVQTAQLDNGLTVSGSTLYAGTPTGLTTYQINPLVSSPVTVSVQVPKDSANLGLVPGSFDKPPTQIVSGVTSDTYVWDRTVAFGNTDLSFSWQTKLSNLTAGENVAVTLGASVGFVNQGTNGSVTLPGTGVTAAPIISLIPTSATAQPGGTATYDVRLTNPTAAAITYNLTVQGEPGSWTVALPSQETVAPGGTVDATLHLTPDAAATLGAQTFTVQAGDNSTGAAGSAAGTLTVAGVPIPAPDATARGVVVELIPTQSTAGQGMPAHFVVRVTNTGSADDQFSLAASGLPQGVFASFGQFFIDVPPGAGNSRDVTLTLTTSTGTAAGSDPFTVTATSETRATVTGTTNGTLDVAPQGVSVSLNPASAAPGDTLQLDVTNLGQATETYNLAVAGPAGLVATLGASQVTLAAGASMQVPVTTSAAGFAASGPLNLFATATATDNPAVQAGASAVLQVPTTQGLGANFTPASQALAAPGMAEFPLIVQNSGNSDDTYTATIVGTDGPVSASFLGLDGLPTQTVPIFRLPGLTSGVLMLEASLATMGQGMVHVEVKSLSTGTETAMATAAISVALIGTGTKLQVGPNPGVVGQPVTLSATVSPATGTGVPTGPVTFTIDGQPQSPVNLQVVNGQDVATLVTSALAAGPHTITASYGGDPSFLGSASGPVPETINAPGTSTMLEPVTNPYTVGQLVTLTAIVTATNSSTPPTGDVIFTIDGQPLPAAPLSLVNGQDEAIVTTSTLPAGMHQVGASYVGNAAFSTSAATPLGLAINAIATAARVISSANPAVVGQVVTFTATVTAASGGTPSGSVVFTVDGQAEPPAMLQVVGGQAEATFVTSTLTAGGHTITASYGGDPTFAPVTSLPLDQAINLAATSTMLKSSPNPSSAGEAVTLSATVTSLGPIPPVGTVTFFDGTNVLGTAMLDGQGSATIVVQSQSVEAAATLAANLGAGTHTLSAAYGGSPADAASVSAPLTQVVAGAHAGDGPRVTNLLRYGYHQDPTTLLVAFDQALNASHARDVHNYRIVTLGGAGRGGSAVGHVTPVRSASYDAKTHVVTLHPAGQLDVHNTYELVIKGTGRRGVSGATGRLLDGKGNGKPGSDFVGQVTLSTLAGPSGALSAPAFANLFEVPTHPSKRVSAAAVDALSTSGGLSSALSLFRRGGFPAGL